MEMYILPMHSVVQLHSKHANILRTTKLSLSKAFQIFLHVSKL